MSELVDTAEPVDLAVVGGGIAGLVVAAEAARAGLRVVLCERGASTGGMVRPLTIAGIETDAGAESFATRNDAVSALIADLDLPLEPVEPRLGGAHLVWPDPDGGIQRAPLPRRTVLGIPADPLAADVVRIMGEDAACLAAAERTLPVVAADEPDAPEPDLHTLAATRLGPRVAELLVDPLCRSVYSRPARAVRLSRLHPVLWRRYQEHGSLVAAAETLASEARPGSAVGGVRGGMWRLAAALADVARAHGARILTGVEVEALQPTGIGYDLLGRGLPPVRARRVVVATDARTAAGLLAALDGRVPIAESRSSDQSPPVVERGSKSRDETLRDPTTDAVAIAHVVVEAAGLDAYPVGSGVIVAPGTGSRAKALTHVDAKWPWVAEALPQGVHVLRLSARDPHVAGWDDPTTLASEIALLTGVEVGAGDLREVKVTRWPAAASGALPAEVVADAERRSIRLVGASVAGTGLAAVVPHARSVATALIAEIGVRAA